MSTELSVIIPCRDEGATLHTLLQRLDRVVSHHAMNVETLIIDDGSVDDTLEVATRAAHEYISLHVRVLLRKHLLPGLGGVLRYGMAFARGRHSVLLLPDEEDPLDLLPIFLAHLRGGKHLVQASRFDRLKSTGNSSSLLQKAYRAMSRLLVGIDVPDAANSFCAFDRIFVQALGLTSNGFNIGPELTFKIFLCGGNIAYVPGKVGKRRAGTPQMFRLSAEIWGYAWVLLRAGLHRSRLVRWF